MDNNVLSELTRITTAVSYIDSPQEQVEMIVNSVSQSIGVDVCSLYQTDSNNNLVLLASHGLDASQPITIPQGKGLVGRVVESKHTLNVCSAPDHPSYFFVPKSGEEKFHGFCATPLVDHGVVVGVLVVQTVAPQLLDKASEAFLETLSSHLAIIVRTIHISDGLDDDSLGISCVAGSPGIGMGSAIIVSSRSVEEVKTAYAENPQQEKQSLKHLVATLNQQIDSDKATISQKNMGNIDEIFFAMQMFLKDPMFINLVETFIDTGYNLPSSLKKAVGQLISVFNAMEDVYLKAKADDIRYLGNRLYNLWLDEGGVKNIDTSKPYVLVGKQIDISHISEYSGDNLVAIVTGEGSLLSHVSVIANALSVPAVMGLSDKRLPSAGNQLIVDGYAGRLFVDPGPMIISAYNELANKESSKNAIYDELKNQPATTLDGVAVKLFVNTGLLADLSPGIKHGADGVGLYRTEIPFLIRDSFPTEDEQVQVYQKVLEAYQGKPVYMRTLDVGGDKQLPYFPLGIEENPALGWRGIRFSLDNIQLLITQLRAMLRASVGHNELHVLIPMVSSTQELDEFRDCLSKVMQQLSAEGYAVEMPKIGVMIEVPAAISQLPFWENKIDFISVGTNDLSQYLLALDRNNSRVANRFDHVHPAVLHELYRIINTAKSYRIPVSICGEMSSDPVAVLLLLGMGVTKFSLGSSKLPKIKYLIRHVVKQQAEALLQKALEKDNVIEIRKLANDFIQKINLAETL
ncbi:phosphoenolpyruvate--protein phosphotransferase [Dasania sp. GY-MA-18]|uniref:phosphoenolpyruvate--protein phosphotransferase n=1 Tax=Dasania phycosphaerae TaxID=2950436 RepID=A0A9J6RKY6_9GAMM|nr:MULTISPECIES: phosphoenolpyruvate--protein phosphotransferase [Dasania]MCR8922943.1 phosphoenolpyruvate--protein phosphotransferase [Dasania sp. GY-MA-18]MCZ0865374.1 phosphoenolpyruvate--protein phosphotransferase [Dasania phycosphaerae]MCZ0869099.1 phosphoenolpyruvate--protein phosphotransferase [Dasania phycosphaerae]